MLFAGATGSTDKDYLALEIIEGHIHYTYDVGNRARSLTDRLRRGVADNRWHRVFIQHPTLDLHILRVDDSVVTESLSNSRTVHFDMTDTLYVAGVSTHMFSRLPKLVCLDRLIFFCK